MRTGEFVRDLPLCLERSVCTRGGLWQTVFAARYKLRSWA